MRLKRLASKASAAWEVPRDLMLGRYPDFVTGGPLAKGHVPVFVFHSAEPESFERKLLHLQDNGYVSLSADDYFRVLVGAVAPPDRAVVLSFDDGRASLWSVGAPLLRRYGMKGIVFLVPGRTRSGGLGPTLDDARRDADKRQRLLERENGPDGFLTWEEIEHLSRSGVYDFQSHTLLHARVHTGPTLAGFLTPARRHGYAAMDVPLLVSEKGDQLADQAALGTPLLRSEPRTSEALRFLEDPCFRERCIQMVEDEGGEGFFTRNGWERRLKALLHKRPISGRVETHEEREGAIRRELVESRRLIEEHTGQTVVHLCYPWHAAGPTARRLAKAAGYRTAFCGKVPGVTITLPGGDPLSIARLSEDYVELLPGKGRRELSSILAMKWRRWMGEQ